jgi:RES domain-containing protein
MARDLGLLDAIDACPREPFDGRVWRVVREGRDPAIGSPSQSRWCDGAFDVLYTSLERDGAIAEIHAFLSAQPVFPSKPVWFRHELKVRASRSLRIADLAQLQKLGVDTGSYKERRYKQTQDIADAAYFLDFDGLVVPSARWPCHNLVLFTARLQPEDIKVVPAGTQHIDWSTWRKGAAH